MEKITARDRLLIYLLALVLFILAAVYWVYMPAARNYNDYKSQYDAAAARREQVDTALESAPAMQAEIDRLATQLEALETGFMPCATQSEVDLYLTGLIQSFGLSPVSMAVAPLAEKTVAPYDSAAAKASLLGGQATPPDDTAPAGMVWIIDAVFSGSMSGFNLLADALPDEAGLYLQSLSYTAPQGGDAFTFNVTFIGVSAS